MTLVNDCYQCGLCTGICPKRRVSKYSPRHKVNRYLLQDEREVTWKCLTCGLCSHYCPQDVNYLEFVRDLRQQELNEEVVAHKSIFTTISQLMARHPNAHGVPTRFEGETDQDSDIAYFPGCLDFFDCFLDVGADFHEIGESSIKLLNRIDVKPRILSLRCCGHDALWQGDRGTFSALKKLNEQQIGESGIQTLVTSCAECFRTFSKDYELDVDVVHISQILERNIGKLDIQASGLAITYHDPCRLGRHMGVYDAPRKLFSHVKGLALRELSDARDDAQCCGVSAWISCDTEAKFLLLEKLEKAVAADAVTLVTACPKCYAHLNCVKNENPPEREFNIDIQDLTTFLLKLADGMVKQ